ncbi:MAG TPA: hypothetical protein VNE41_02805 [Chitinophagaceae bacterium]|nr:hypothetical protein [Chitinophagaceae bacterium]
MGGRLRDKNWHKDKRQSGFPEEISRNRAGAVQPGKGTEEDNLSPSMLCNLKLSAYLCPPKSKNVRVAKNREKTGGSKVGGLEIRAEHTFELCPRESE